MLDRDHTAKDILLVLLAHKCDILDDLDHNGKHLVRSAYKLTDALIEKSDHSYVRFRIGPVEKNLDVVPNLNVSLSKHTSHYHGSKTNMAFVLKDDQQVSATLEFFDRKGVLVETPVVDGLPVWESSDPAKISVAPAADGLSALIVAVGLPGEGATVTATADADLGEGVKNVVTTGDVTIVGGDIATSNIHFGDPVVQP